MDGFQGREVDILLLSTVRATHSTTAASEINSSTIGFVADVRRMNVALTRAKISLWILGNARTLQTNHNWAALLKDAKERSLIMTAKMPYHSMFKTASKSKCFENSDKHARPLKHEKKVKDSCQNVTKILDNDMGTFEKKMRCIASEVKDRNKGNGDDSAFSALGKDVLFKEKSSEDEHISIKDLTCVVAKCESKSSCDGMFTVLDQQVCNSGRECKDKMKIATGKAILGKRQSKFQNSRNNLDHPAEETGGGHKAAKLSELKRPAMYSGADRSISCIEVSAPPMKGCHEGRDADDQSRAPNQSRVSEISKRKQQREAVDAILYSSLISTKKDETLTKVSAKSPFSSVTKGNVKPPKTRNGKRPLLFLLIWYAVSLVYVMIPLKEYFWNLDFILSF